MSNQKRFSTRVGVAVEQLLKTDRKKVLGPEQLQPSAPGLCVAGVLNAGFFTVGNRSFLVARVDEVVDPGIAKRVKEQYGAEDVVPFFDYKESALLAVPVNHPANYNPDSDVLLVSPGYPSPLDRQIYFAYLSHLRLIEIDSAIASLDGTIVLAPSNKHDCYGCEDARSVVIEDTVTIAYNALGICGSSIHRAQLRADFSVAAREMIFAPDQKHGCLFPQRIDGQLMIVTRPLVRTYVGAAGIWIYSSDEGSRWKVLGPLVLPRHDSVWDNVRVGPGPSPLLTEAGWLLLYYGVDHEKSYHVGAVLLDSKDPMQVIARTSNPILSPEFDWELNGRRADTVFPSGAKLDGNDRVTLYYGAADTCVGVATFSLGELLSRMNP